MTTLMFTFLMLVLTLALRQASRPGSIRLSWNESQRARALRLREQRERELVARAEERAKKGTVYGPEDPAVREGVKQGVILMLRPDTLSPEEREQARRAVRRRTEALIAMRRAA